MRLLVTGAAGFIGSNFVRWWLQRHPDDHRVNERAVSMVGNVVPLMGNLCDQLTDQLNKVLKQVGNLPRYQVDWSALRHRGPRRVRT